MDCHRSLGAIFCLVAPVKAGLRDCLEPFRLQLVENGQEEPLVYSVVLASLVRQVEL